FGEIAEVLAEKVQIVGAIVPSAARQGELADPYGALSALHEHEGEGGVDDVAVDAAVGRHLAEDGFDAGFVPVLLVELAQARGEGCAFDTVEVVHEVAVLAWVG